MVRRAAALIPELWQRGDDPGMVTRGSEVGNMCIHKRVGSDGRAVLAL